MNIHQADKEPCRCVYCAGSRDDLADYAGEQELRAVNALERAEQAERDLAEARQVIENVRWYAVQARVIGQQSQHPTARAVRGMLAELLALLPPEEPR